MPLQRHGVASRCWALGGPTERYVKAQSEVGLPCRGDATLLVSQDQVHDPATSDVVFLLATVLEYIGVVTTRFFQGISQDG
jgi:hypothetical protein